MLNQPGGVAGDPVDGVVRREILDLVDGLRVGEPQGLQPGGQGLLPFGAHQEIDHGLGFTTLYAHLSQINVSRGDWVRPGTVIGLAGSSGRSTGPHLHYEIRYKGAPFDPTKFVQGEK